MDAAAWWRMNNATTRVQKDADTTINVAIYAAVGIEIVVAAAGGHYSLYSSILPSLL